MNIQVCLTAGARLAAATILGIMSAAFAGEQIGPTHGIAEPDLLEEIHKKLQEKERSGELARLQREAIERSEQSAMTPKPVDGVVRTVMPRTFYWDPTVRVPQDIRDTSGNVIAQAGQTINPLDYVTLAQHLLFFDGRDEEQVVKAADLFRHYDGRVKPIMTGGNVRDLMQRWKAQVYFDQGGTLVAKLGIKQVPALVSQDGKRLRIDEIAVKRP